MDYAATMENAYGIALSTSAGSIVCLMLGVWLASLYYRDASLVDRYWGAGFGVSAVAVVLMLGTNTLLQFLLLTLVLCWGMRLSIYLTMRNWGHGEDPRYVSMREKRGDAFAWKSLYIVFGFQGLIMWSVGMPITLGLVELSEATLQWNHILGLICWSIGMFFEVAGDMQLSRFKANPKNKGTTLQHGVWRYTRHPNYFGDAMLWWGIYLFVCTGDWARWTIVCPAFMTFLLIKVSGVPLTEARLSKTRPDYADYVARTPSFFPWFPKAP